jgi:chemotaxis protein CheX
MASANPVHAPENSHKDWLPTLELATREVFETMLASQLTSSAAAPADSLDVTAMVGLAGMLCGMISIRCQSKAAALIASKMLGIDPDKVGPEVADALGEVCNMVAGNFKNKVPGMGDGCMLSLPTVVTGGNYAVYSEPGSPRLAVNQLFESMPLVVTLHIQA